MFVPLNKVPTKWRFYFTISYFFHYDLTDLVNTKTNIPLRVGEQRQTMYLDTSRRLGIYNDHYSPPLQGIVVCYIMEKAAYMPIAIHDDRIFQSHSFTRLTTNFWEKQF